MKKNNYLFYNDYIKTGNINNKIILLAKTKNSYLIGPLINNNFDGTSFIKRIKSNSIHQHKIYKKISPKKSINLINEYYTSLNDNEVIELLKNGEKQTHKIIKVPVIDYDKE